MQPSTDHLAESLVQILFEGSFMTLATADADGVPWVTPVEYVCDESMRLYWTSHVDARHSRNVRANPRAAISIFDSHQIAGVHATVQAIYAEGPVEELVDADVEPVRPALRQWLAWRADRRAPSPPPADGAPEPDATPWRQYRLTAEHVYALDPAGHPDIPGVRVWKVEVDLAEAFGRAVRSRRGSGFG